MITVQYTELSEWAEELEPRLIEGELARVSTFPEGPRSPDGTEQLHVTTAGALQGEQLHQLTLLARSEESAEAQRDQVRAALEERGIEMRPGRFVA